ncbi:MAG: transglycosylase [Gracilibacter sp. BRH_c7a]|nr:MAG: transglycosylase [Gracilibacter sp. BRH_c7a]
MFIRRRTIKRTIVVLLLLLLIVTVSKHNLIEKMLYPYPYKQTVEKYALEYGVDPYLVISVIREESRFKSQSVSAKGAVGLMQLMPDTAKEIAVWLGENYEEVDLTKPDDNIRYGTWYLATRSKEFSGNTIITLASYNAGIGRVKSWLKESTKNFNSYLIEDIPYKETREYVQKVLKSYGKYNKLYNIDT